MRQPHTPNGLADFGQKHGATGQNAALDNFNMVGGTSDYSEAPDSTDFPQYASDDVFAQPTLLIDRYAAIAGFSDANNGTNQNVISSPTSGTSDPTGLIILLPLATGAFLVSGGTIAAGTAIINSSIGANGATPAQVQQAIDESGLSVTGAGIKVGVLSDSFNDLGGAAADEAGGALPPASQVQVLSDLASGGTDEGRALMQIVHDVAPGASLAFYTAFNSEQDFANGILALAADGCKVICDDVSYYDEPFFQNGIVAQAIQTVEAEGVVYLTAAGNDGSNAYQSAWTPISSTTFDGIALKDTESFSGSAVQTITVTNTSSYTVSLLLQWNQPFGAATSDLEILVFRNGRLVGSATNVSNGEPNNPWVEYDFTRSGTYQIAIENLSGPDPGLIKEIAAGDGLPVTISGANVGTVYGHAMTPGAITVGAVSTAQTPAFGVSPAVSESFSDSGAGTELLFSNNGTALSSPDLLSPVAVSGVDNINTTVPGNLTDLYGTSAAAPSVAGIVALMLQANPNLTPAQVEQILQASALAMANPAVSGAGLVQADVAVAKATALLTVSSGEVLNVSAGQTDAGLIVLNGGTLNVLSGGTVSGTAVSSGGTENVYGTATSTAVSNGGVEDVFSGGAVNGATLSDGKLVVSNGGTAAGTLGFAAAGGEVVLAPGGTLSGATISGYAPGDHIDLQGLGFTSAVTSATYAVNSAGTGGTLTIASGAKSVSLALQGQYNAGNFTLQGDGTGGTLVGSPLNGVNYVADVYGSYASASSLASLKPVGANTVALTADFGIDAANSTVYQNAVAGGYTESNADIATTIDAAVNQGLSAMVRPLVDFLPSNYDTAPGQTNPNNGSYYAGEWRSYFNPGAAGSASANTFFASYQTMIVQQAALAQANGANLFCIGTELDQIAGPAYQTYWNNIISAVRNVFTGKLTYAADWDDALSPWQYGGTGLTAGTGNVTTQISFWNQLDYVGIDEYAPISDLANPTLNQLIAGWTQVPSDSLTLAVTGQQSLISYYENVAAATGKPLIFTEIGYANSSDAASSPATPGYNENGNADGAVADPTLQANLYQAYFDAWQQYGNVSLAGAYLWNWEPSPNAGNNTWTVQGEPALSVVTSAYTNNSVQPPVTVSSGNTLNVSSGQTDNGLIILSGGTVNVLSGGTALSTTLSGGTQVVYAGGTASGTTGSGGAQYDYGTVNGTTLSGGAQFVETGGTASGTTLSGGAYQVVSSGGEADGTSQSGSFEYIVAGGTVSGTTLIGVTQYDYGTASNTTLSGSTQYLYGTANSTTLSGGAQFIYVGGTASGTTISGGGYQVVYGEADGTSQSGSYEYIAVGGTVSGTTLSGVTQYDYGAANSTTLDGSVQYVGGIATNTTLSGGAQLVVAGGTASATTLSGGAYQVVYSGGEADNTIESGGYEYIAVGATVSGTTLTGATEFVYGTATSTTLDGSVQYVGGIATSNTLSGGAQLVVAGGTASATTLSGGAYQVVYSGGVADGTNETGSYQFIVAGGTAGGTTLNGSLQYDYGVADSTSMTGNGTQIVGIGGTASGTVLSGSTQYIDGIAINTSLGGGAQIVEAGGTASATTLSGGAYQLVEAGGEADGTTLTGGYEYVAAGGSASGTTVVGGATQYVSGLSSDTTLSSGGSEIVYAGGSASGTIMFVSGGALTINDAASFSATLAGFDAPSDTLDLANVAYLGSATTLNYTSTGVQSGTNIGTLTVSNNGTQVAAITLLGNYIAGAGNFTASTDGQNGMIITDPPVSSTVLVNVHS